MTLKARPVAVGTSSSHHRLCNALYNLMWEQSRTWGQAQRPHYPKEKPLPDSGITMGH